MTYFCFWKVQSLNFGTKCNQLMLSNHVDMHMFLTQQCWILLPEANQQVTVLTVEELSFQYTIDIDTNFHSCRFYETFLGIFPFVLESGTERVAHCMVYWFLWITFSA